MTNPVPTFLSRRVFLGGGLAAVVAAPAMLGAASGAAAAATALANGTYRPLNGPDANGIRLPNGFSARVIARTNQRPVVGGALWPIRPDGCGTTRLADGGWILYVNSEGKTTGSGSVTAAWFRPGGTMYKATRILSGSTANCSGGITPWGTWISCEERTNGIVYECDASAGRSVTRLGMGKFRHEAAAVHEPTRTVYLTEDEPDGCFYRYRYNAARDLSSGVLEVAVVANAGVVTWVPVPRPIPSGTATRYQVAGARRFNHGEGCFQRDGVVWFCSTTDNRVWRYDIATARLSVFFDGKSAANAGKIGAVDNIYVTPAGRAYICDDSGTRQIALIEGATQVSTVARMANSTVELAGVCMSPDGSRLYTSDQGSNNNGVGRTFEIRGPFR